MNKQMKIGIAAILLLTSLSVLTYAGKPENPKERTNIHMETHTGFASQSTSGLVEGYQYEGVRHVSVTFEGERLNAGENYKIEAAVPGSTGWHFTTIITLDEVTATGRDGVSVEFDTNVWRIYADILEPKEMYWYATSTYVGPPN